MKRKLIYGITALMFAICLTGCGKTEEKEEVSNIDAAFLIKCEAAKENMNGMETQNTTTYYFNDEQYIIAYSIATTQKFEDKSVYEEYKKAQEESAKDTSIEDVTYSLKTDDKNKTLVFTMTIKNMDVSNAESEEEKETYKASNMLKTNEDAGSTCTVNGISKDALE